MERRRWPSTAASAEGPQEEEATTEAGQTPEAEISAECMHQAKPQDLAWRESVMRAVFLDAGTVEGVHDLRPVGPWPVAGMVPPKNRRVPGAWGCSR